MTRSADQEYITTAIGKKYRVEKSSDFEYVTTAIGEECFLFGVDVFAHDGRTRANASVSMTHSTGSPTP